MMELVKALEELSLQVRHRETNLNHDQSRKHQAELQPIPEHDMDPISNTMRFPQYIVGQNYELQKFNNSIETLFEQITKFERDKFFHKQSSEESLSRQSSQDDQSLSDDSVSSSQHSYPSSSSSSGADPYSSLVDKLLRKDLTSITATVNNIGRIIAIGNEMENSYAQILETDISCRDGSRSAILDSELKRAKALCDTYSEVCWQEPHLKNFPTISRFNGSYLKLKSLLDARIQMHNLDNDFEPDDNIAMVDRDEEAAYLAGLGKDQHTNWTENKLYINRSQ